MIRGEAHAMADYMSASAVPGSRVPGSRVPGSRVPASGRAGAGSLAWLRQANKWALVSLPLSAAWLEGLGSALGIMVAVIAIRQIKADGHRQRGYWVSVASIAVGVAGLLAVLVMGMVAYLDMAISLGHR
jgi:hypothetical protein